MVRKSSGPGSQFFCIAFVVLRVLVDLFKPLLLGSRTQRMSAAERPGNRRIETFFKGGRI